MHDGFMFGAVYIIEQEYSDETILRDLKNMKDCGCDLVTLWPVANPWLARSSTEWVFDRTRFVLDCCEALGMKVILQLFGQNQSQEFMPDSVCLPEMECVDERGGTLGRGSTCFWVNLNHPTVREYLDKYFREAITALKDHPALYAWDVFNEAHHRSDDRWTQELYRDWLKQKYGNIEEINYKWYRRYENYDQIRPENRQAPYSVWSSLLPSVEYEKFRSVNLTDICRFLYETAKKYDSEHPVIIDGSSSYILSNSIIERNNDEFETAYVPDIYGSTFYPKSWGRNYRETPWTLSMYFAVPASAAKMAGKPYLVDELQTHTQSVLTPGSEVTPDELTAWILMCIFTGARGMQLWRWRPFLHGYQATGRGLTRMDGLLNKRAEAVKDLMDVIRQNEELFADSVSAAPMVRIAMTYDIRLFFDGMQRFSASGKNLWAENLEGWYKLFWNWGIQTDFVDLAHMNGSEEPAPVIVLPGAVRISGQQAKELCAYVEKGGILLADSRLGTMDEWGCVPETGIPGETLCRLFGLVETDVNSGRELVIGDSRIPAGFQYQELELLDEDTKVLARMEDGLPAIVEHTYGKGKTIYFNSFEGIVLLKNLYPELQNIIRAALPFLNGICVQKSSHVHLNCMKNGSRTLLLAVNFAAENEKIRFEGIAPGTRMFELFTKRNIVLNENSEVVLPANSHSIFVLVEK